MIWMITATICAYFIKGLCGFANTLIFTAILSFGIDNINISPVELLVGYSSNVIIAWKERKFVDWKVCLPLGALVLAGSIPGIYLLKNADSQMIKILFGIVIILIGVEMFLRDRMQKPVKQSKVVLGIIGIVSGMLCGLYGVGALLAAYVGRVTDNSRAFKANLCMVFIMDTTFRMVLYAVTGIITLKTIKQAAVLFPIMLVSLAAGMKCGSFLNEKTVKKVVILMLILSGIGLILNNL